MEEVISFSAVKLQGTGCVQSVLTQINKRENICDISEAT